MEQAWAEVLEVLVVLVESVGPVILKVFWVLAALVVLGIPVVLVVLGVLLVLVVLGVLVVLVVLEVPAV